MQLLKVVCNILQQKITAIVNKQIQRDDMDHIIAAVVFYVTFNFKLSLMDKKEFVEWILLLQDSTILTVYTSLNTVFAPVRG